MTRKARQFRFHHAGEISIDSELQLDKSASHHLLTVLRAGPGDQLELFNGDGFNYSAVLGSGSTAKRAVIIVESRSENLTESPLIITMVQAVSRGERMDQSIRQAVELGASAIQPVYSRQAQKPGDAKRVSRKQEHWYKIMISASEQSGRVRIPDLHPARSLSSWIEDTDTGLTTTPCIVLHPAATNSLGRLDAMQQFSIAIGPESGFDTDEVDTMIAAGAIACRMGPRTLRTETAGMHGDGSK